MFRTDMGYIQGMSYLAATLLLHIGDEYLCFETFSNIMHRTLIFMFYSFDMDKVNIFFHIFMKIMGTHIPKLHHTFCELELNCSMFLFEWTVTMFSNVLPLTTVARLWD